MKARAKNLEECTTLFEIEVRPETVEKAFDEVYSEITRFANIPGFRVGKAPKDIVKKYHAANAKEEVLKRLIPEAYRKALAEHKIDPVGLPEISDVSFDGTGPILFKAKVDTRPKFKLKIYKGIKIEKKKISIDDAEADKVMQNLREMNAKYLAVEDRDVRTGDYIVSDLECYVDGKAIHKKRENLWLLVDKDSLLPGLSEKLVGMKKGEEKDVEVKMPDQYPDKFVAGKLARYHVKAKEIKTRVLPAIDNEFAKDLGKGSIEDLKAEIKKELEARAKVTREIDMENQLLNKLMDENVFNVPSAFVDRQLNLMVENSKKRLLEKGFKKEDLDKKDGEFKEKFKNDAVRQVRLLFILDEIAGKENIETSEEDVKIAYKAISEQTKKSEEEVKSYYEKEDRVNSLKEKIKEEHTIEFLLKSAQIVEEDARN